MCTRSRRYQARFVQKITFVLRKINRKCCHRAALFDSNMLSNRLSLAQDPPVPAAVGVVNRRPIGAVVTVQRVRRRLQTSRLDSGHICFLLLVFFLFLHFLVVGSVR